MHLRLSKYCQFNHSGQYIYIYWSITSTEFWTDQYRERIDQRPKEKIENMQKEVHLIRRELTDIAAMHMWKRPSSAVGSHGGITLKISQTQSIYHKLVRSRPITQPAHAPSFPKQQTITNKNTFAEPLQVKIIHLNRLS